MFNNCDTANYTTNLDSKYGNFDRRGIKADHMASINMTKASRNSDHVLNDVKSLNYVQ